MLEVTSPALFTVWCSLLGTPREADFFPRLFYARSALCVIIISVYFLEKYNTLVNNVRRCLSLHVY